MISMRILLLIHPDFYDSEPQRPLGEIRGWLDQYAASLASYGHQVQKFQSRETRVRDFDWVHCFSSVDAETWVALANAGCRVAVTPSLAANPGERFQRQASAAGVLIERGLVRAARALSQRRWPPLDQGSFASAVDRFLVVSDPWRAALSRAWGLSEQKIPVLSQNPVEAARAAHEAFES